ncbi:MAG: MBL fold metallo-hydrolase [Dehalobacterium sp.]|jgi:L-ascorbate metabolism protein UlaG (beta-lactamase superfamily)
MQIIYVSNAGVLLDFQDQRVLIDGLCASHIPPYQGLPDIIKRKIMESIPPYHDIDLLLFTHEHEDHFDAPSTVQFLKNHPKALVAGSGDILREILHLASELTPQCIVQEEIRQIGDLYIHFLPMKHMGRDYQDVNHISYLIEGRGKKVLHVGDAQPVSENFRPYHLTEAQVDLLVAPFPYVARPSARQVIVNHIKPQQIAALHFPRRELDDGKWINITMKNYKRVQEDFIPTIFLQKVGESINI